MAAVTSDTLAIILGGGQGSRLFPLTATRSKPAVPIGGKSRLIEAALPQDDPLQRQPDISVARAKLGWTPKVELDEGLKRTLDSLR